MLDIPHRPVNRWSIVAWTVLLLTGTVLTIAGIVDLANTPGARDWRVTSKYLLLFLGLGAAIAGVARTLRTPPLMAAFSVGLVAALASGAAGALAIAMALVAAAYVLGRFTLPREHNTFTDCVLVGIVIAGTVLGLTATLPVHHVGIYSIAMVAVFVAGRRQLGARSVQLSELLRIKPSPERMAFMLHCAIGAAVLLHLLVSLMPEIGHDALAMHLFIPAQVKERGAWDFNVGLYIWASMPLLVDWIYTVAYILAGETAARLVNFGGIVLLAGLVRQAARWAYASEAASLWAVLLFLVTPLTFLESSSLYIESIWAALLIGAILGLLRVASGQGRPADFILAGILLGGALASKAVTVTILPILVLLVGVRVGAWWKPQVLRPLMQGFVALAIVGAIPYVTAFILTGNPVYPFFNEFFPATRQVGSLFSAPQLFERGSDWQTLYRMTFHSGNFLEGTPGAAGFQWLMLFVPAAIAMVLARAKRACALAAIVIGGILIVFGQTAYLRYVFPFFALACALVGPALTAVRAAPNAWVWRLSLTACTAVVLLNLAHLQASTYYGNINAKILLNPEERRAYKRRATPVHAAIPLVNELNLRGSPVAFFADPLAAGLRADALHVNWYNQRFSAQVYAASNPTILVQLLVQHDVEWLLVDEAWPQAIPRALAKAVSSEVGRVGTVSIRKIMDSLRYTEEQVASPTFAPGSSWAYAEGVLRLPGRGVAVQVGAAASTVVPVRAGGWYRYEATASCYEMPALGRLQVNWLASSGAFISAEVQTFPCSPTADTKAMDVQAPQSATHAVIYASGHEATPILFEKVSFRH